MTKKIFMPEGLIGNKDQKVLELKRLTDSEDIFEAINENSEKFLVIHSSSLAERLGTFFKEGFYFLSTGRNNPEEISVDLSAPILKSGRFYKQVISDLGILKINAKKE